MNLDDIQKMWEKDSHIDPDNLHTESLNIPSFVTWSAFKIFIDPMSEMFLLGTTIDYSFEDIEKGIYENKFIFTANKEIATSCGCGISFAPRNM